MKSLIVSLAALTAATTVIGLSACTVFDGPVLTPSDLDGVATTVARDHQDFTAIDASGLGDVAVQVGDHYSVEVTADAALHEHINTSVVDGTLRIEQEFTFVGSSPDLDYVITMPTVTAISLSGAGSITAAGVDSETLDINLRGLGDIYVVGRAKSASVEVAGAGSAQLANLRTGNLDVTITGLGDAYVLATRSLEARIEGAGDIHAAGTATDTSVTIGGVGDFHGEEFESQTATVRISGLGSVDIAVSNSLDATVSGLGDVTYYGDPHVTADTSGLGSVSSGS